MKVLVNYDAYFGSIALDDVNGDGKATWSERGWKARSGGSNGEGVSVLLNASH